MNLPIQIALLCRTFEAIAVYPEKLEGAELSLGSDYFWSIPADELSNVYSRHAKIAIGQLSESWQHIEDMLDGESGVLPHHLIWLSDVLRAIGQEIDR